VPEDQDLQLFRSTRLWQQTHQREQVARADIHTIRPRTPSLDHSKSAESSEPDASESRGRVCEPYGLPRTSCKSILSAVPEGLRAWATAFPDGFVEMTNVFAVARWVAVEWRAQGTQTGPLRGEPPSGRRFERRGCAVAEVEEGKIVRYRDYFDRAQMYEGSG
jgi:predicted ester cyclase